MGMFSLFKKKSATTPQSLNERLHNLDLDLQSQQIVLRLAEEIAHPYVAGHNFLELFKSVPEVFWPIDFIASRIAQATFEVRRYKDDSVVWSRNKMLTNIAHPNCVQTWAELVYSHFVYKLATGNAYFRAAMPEAFKEGKKYKMCDNFWSLPSDYITIVPPRTYNLPLYGVASQDELIDYYKLAYDANQNLQIPPFQVFHDRDGVADFTQNNYMKAGSRLASQIKPISNLIAVYEARNIIYVKRGGLGFIVSQKSDATGSVAMTEKEKKDVRDQMEATYGVGVGQSPIGFTDVPLSFIRTNLSISDLQPFDETLEDAIKIAGAYGIPSVLVPRKDQSTFSNQSTAEKAVYSSVIIPMAQRFCNELTVFLGLDADGYYLNVNFDAVDCLQVGMKEAEDVKKMKNDRCRQQFHDGLISINDWRAQLGESMIETDEVFAKLKWDMTPDELARIESILNNNSNIISNATGGEEGLTVPNEGE